MLVSVAQRLVRRVCSYCKKPYSPSESALAAWGLDRITGAAFMHGNGCFNCNDKGYKGRTGIYEVLVVDEEVQDMILKRRSAQEITRILKEKGKLRTLKDDAADKVLQGIPRLRRPLRAVMA